MNYTVIYRSITNMENYWTRTGRDDHDPLEALKIHGKFGLDTKFS
jgi:hypothetical protein